MEAASTDKTPADGVEKQAAQQGPPAADGPGVNDDNDPATTAKGKN